MLLKFAKENQKMRVVFGCDFCHRVISDPAKAIYAWQVDRKTLEIPEGVIFVFHTNTCDQITLDNDNEQDKNLWQWAPLTRFPAELLNGLDKTWEQAQDEQTELQPKD
ncbi:MAG: hypothetical protein WCD86_05350 [Ktedonobacteraceae bacterium]